MFAFDHCICR